MINLILENTFIKFVEHITTTFVICGVFVGTCVFLLQQLLHTFKTRYSQLLYLCHNTAFQTTVPISCDRRQDM